MVSAEKSEICTLSMSIAHCKKLIWQNPFTFMVDNFLNFLLEMGSVIFISNSLFATGW
jgi:hypothetical protein